MKKSALCFVMLLIGCAPSSAWSQDFGARRGAEGSLGQQGYTAPAPTPTYRPPPASMLNPSPGFQKPPTRRWQDPSASDVEKTKRWNANSERYSDCKRVYFDSEDPNELEEAAICLDEVYEEFIALDPNETYGVDAREFAEKARARSKSVRSSNAYDHCLDVAIRGGNEAAANCYIDNLGSFQGRDRSSALKEIDNSLFSIFSSAENDCTIEHLTPNDIEGMAACLANARSVLNNRMQFIIDAQHKEMIDGAPLRHQKTLDRMAERRAPSRPAHAQTYREKYGQSWDCGHLSISTEAQQERWRQCDECETGGGEFNLDGTCSAPGYARPKSRNAIMDYEDEDVATPPPPVQGLPERRSTVTGPGDGSGNSERESSDRAD